MMKDGSDLQSQPDEGKKTLSKELLLEYGFLENGPVANETIEVLTKNNVNIVMKEEQFFYSIVGIDYPLKDLAGLKKIYKEIKNEELVRVTV